MSEIKYLEPLISELLSENALQKIRQTMETIAAHQRGLYTLSENEDSAQLDLLKIGTVFQIFFIVGQGPVSVKRVFR